METEIKLRVDLTASKLQLTRIGFAVARRRVHEINDVFDTPDGALLRAEKLLRLRQAGRRTTIAFKGPPAIARHKSREEIESHVTDATAMRRILENLGFAPVFRYEKYRTEYAKPGEPGVAMLDETPIGNFLELEGPARWIDRTARAIGRSPADYITDSYGSLYREYCRAKGVKPDSMVFTRRRQRS